MLLLPSSTLPSGVAARRTTRETGARRTLLALTTHEATDRVVAAGPGAVGQRCLHHVPEVEEVSIERGIVIVDAAEDAIILRVEVYRQPGPTRRGVAGESRGLCAPPLADAVRASLLLGQCLLRHLTTPVVLVYVRLATAVVDGGGREGRFADGEARDADLNFARQSLALLLADVRALAHLGPLLVHEGHAMTRGGVRHRVRV
jgi:hypothetical protein